MTLLSGMGMSRRQFLQAGCLAGCLAVCGAAIPWPASASARNYYAANRARLLADFKGVCDGVRQYIAAAYPGLPAPVVAADALAAFESMLPGMTDLGGDANRNQVYLTQAGWLAAIHAAMKSHGRAAADSGRLFYDLNAMDIANTPGPDLKARGEAFFSRESRDSLVAWAQWTELRTYPGDWVARAYVGDGSRPDLVPDLGYDLGYDMLECGAVKLFKAQGMMDVAPYFCLNDFPRSRAEGTGLVRTGTIAQGAALCDFRHKKGRDVTQGWETEASRF